MTAVAAAIIAAYTPAPSPAQTRCGTEFIYYSERYAWSPASRYRSPEHYL